MFQDSLTKKIAEAAAQIKTEPEIIKVNEKSVEGAVEKIMNEKLIGNQHKIDANKNNKVDAHDFKLLRAQKEKEKANSMKYGKGVKEETELEEATPTAKQVKQGIGIARDKRYAKGNVTGAVKAMDKVNKGIAQHPVVNKELRKQNEEIEIDEAMFPGTKEYEKKYGQSPQQKLKKVGDTEKTAQGEMKKTAKGVMHTRRFTEMLDTYKEGGLKTISEMLIKEEPSQEEFEQEIENHKKKNSGEIRNDKGVAKAFQSASVREEPVNPVSEEVEELDELKKSTLGSYVKKASKDLASRAFDHGEDEHRQYGYGDDDEEDDRVDREEKKIETRQKGIARAANRLAKEETLDELSKSTLGSYVKKSSKDLASRAFDHGEDEHRQYGYGDDDKEDERVDREEKKIETRQKGISRAANRLAKESTIAEREMTDAEMKKREDIVKGMKKGMQGFKQRYGDRAKQVMYATATKQAMKD